MRCPSACIPCTLVLLLASLHPSTATPAESIASASSSVTPDAPTAPILAMADGSAAPEGVDAGDPLNRVYRQPAIDGEDEYEDEVPNIVPELIPAVETRNIRGNGLDDLTAASEPVTVNDPTSSLAADFVSLVNDIERSVREGALDADVQLDSDLEARSLKCTKDGDKCQENGGCCSGFCSWTRDFTCYTVAG